MLQWRIMDGGCLNMVDLSDFELEFSAQVTVSGTMDFDELVEYRGDVEDYIENNIHDCDVEIQDIEESLNIFTEEEYTNLVRNHDKKTLRLRDEIVTLKQNLDTLSETVISLNEQIEVLRGN